MQTVENHDVDSIFRYSKCRFRAIQIFFFKFFRNRDILESGDNDFMSNNNAKDWFYWTVNNIADLGELGIEESALNQCIKGLDFHFLVSQFLKIMNFRSILKIRTKEQKLD